MYSFSACQFLLKTNSNILKKCKCEKCKKIEKYFRFTKQMKDRKKSLDVSWINKKRAHHRINREIFMTICHGKNQNSEEDQPSEDFCIKIDQSTKNQTQNWYNNTQALKKSFNENWTRRRNTEVICTSMIKLISNCLPRSPLSPRISV